MNEIHKPETLLVCRDGEVEDSYYDEIYAARKREVIHAAGGHVLEMIGRPIRNFRLNILDLLSN